jgi:predicted transcriptional regulator
MGEDLRGRLLKLLERYGRDGVSQGELVEVTGYSKSWISELLKELEERGVIARVPGPGKTKRVVLSKYLDPSLGKVVRLGLVRASEYLFLQNFISRLRSHGYEVELVIFGSVSEATAALARAEVHLAIAPIYTQAVFRALGAPIRAYPGGAIGGASLVYRDLEGPILSSRASTMEVATVVLSKFLGTEPSKLGYYRVPEEGVEALIHGRTSALTIWEPYATHLESLGFRRIRLSDFIGKYYCCTLARHENLSHRASDDVKESWTEALAEARKSRLVGEPLSILGMDRSAAERALKEYEYLEHIEWEYIKNVLDYASGFLLNISLVKELLEN